MSDPAIKVNVSGPNGSLRARTGCGDESITLVVQDGRAWLEITGERGGFPVVLTLEDLRGIVANIPLIRPEGESDGV